MKRLVASALTASLLTGPVAAQDSAGDWEILRDQRHRQVMAYVQFSNGLGLTVRCLKGNLDAVIGGLPPPIDAEESAIGLEYRTLGIGHGEGPVRRQRWVVATNDTMAVSLFPAPFARALREGGDLEIRVAGGGGAGRDLVYRVDLPPSADNIDEVLTACDRPLVDDRDAAAAEVETPLLPASLNWERPPRPTFPNRSRYASGFVVISCYTRQNGELRDCIIESVHPADSDFGRAALDSTRRARIQAGSDTDAPVPDMRIHFMVTFRLM